ncbi:hypothetical protein AGABI2DRAFT_114110 [Agaricus bisporus var. bisporus H97]|uniref:hypothetical protein n=1 Tax=Agaricus bisporus var. bisporus (strain H97 / ATCC MYA-4626 / FGSC 10389) TaxID=936046 RepID=UPI00029F60E9|nr:hypothetical protein AGABI2DRAFT_114110 [Agaricus bisporus var. bisporus H97]EKV51376.1 hypothetical protein AGABI2DRAFT_114110 [Agaricus bisporus var. bisporus H97]
MAADYVMTIDSEDEGGVDSIPKSAQDEANLNPEFIFDVADDPYLEIASHTLAEDWVKSGSKPVPISVDDIIARRRPILKRKKSEIEEDDEDSGNSVDESSESEEDTESSAEGFDQAEDKADKAENGEELSGSESDDDPLATSGDDSDIEEEEMDSEKVESSGDDDDSEDETQAEKDRKTAFFDQEIPASKSTHNSFLSMNLSRPLMKAVTNLGFNKPTPIQASTIPVALLGKDVVGNAVTGSGKTAAFMIPMIERLLFREKGKKAAAIRCLVLVPTRELAVQCYEVGTKLSIHTDIRLCLVVGGLSLKSQEADLRSRPDIVIATPGRLIDHIRNSASFSLDALDILVIDEADRILSEGFSDELTEIIKSCPRSRQTMLFSATMTDSVDELVRVSLEKPVRLFVDPKRTTARGLIQEFVRVRAGKEAERSAMLVTLCRRTFKRRVIVFLRSKKLAHQMRIVFSLLGMKCEELHGDLSQEQRLRALQLFRDDAVDFLMATDLASRGLDIKGVETVINYDMPTQLAQYLHRVGRTARAGRGGRAVTLVGEADRKMLRAAIKHAAAEDQVRHRVLPTEALQHWSDKLVELKDEITHVLREEKEEKQMRKAEMELKKGQNLIEHQNEIFSRPARTWFQTGQEKKASQTISKNEHEQGSKPTQRPKAAANTQKHSTTRKAKRRKIAMEEDRELGDGKAITAAIRSAKKASRPAKIGAVESSKPKRRSSSKKTSKSHFDREFKGPPKAKRGTRVNSGKRRK